MGNEEAQTHARSISIGAQKRKRPRPSWEPTLAKDSPGLDDDDEHRTPSWIYDRGAMRSLCRQGCQSPPKHYCDSHECLIPAKRLQGLREIHRWRRHRHMVDIMVQRLPEEIIVLILEWMVLMSQRHVFLDADTDLRRIAARLAGSSSSTDILVPLAERAILKWSIVRLPLEFQNRAGTKVAILAPFASNILSKIRHFWLDVPFEIPQVRLQYPSKLHSATSGMPSLCTQLTGLRSLHITLEVEVRDHPRSENRGFTAALDEQCRKGYAAVTTYRRSVEQLVDAARTSKPDMRVTLEFEYCFYMEWKYWKLLPEVMFVDAGSRHASEVVVDADAKHH